MYQVVFEGSLSRFHVGFFLITSLPCVIAVSKTELINFIGRIDTRSMEIKYDQGK